MTVKDIVSEHLSDTCEDIAKSRATIDCHFNGGSFRIGDIVEWSGGRSVTASTV